MAKIDVFRAARRYCLSCQGDSAAAVRTCADTACPLWPWRLPAPPAAADVPSPDASGQAQPVCGQAQHASEQAQPTCGQAQLPPTAAAAAQSASQDADAPQAVPSAAASATDTAAQGTQGAQGARTHAGAARVPFAPSARRTALRRCLLRVIRRQCLACAGHRTDVRQCAAKDCALWPLRFGVMPETYRAVRNRFFAPKPLSLF